MVVELDVRQHGDLRVAAARATGPTRRPRRRASPPLRARCRRAAGSRRRSGRPDRARAGRARTRSSPWSSSCRARRRRRSTAAARRARPAAPPASSSRARVTLQGCPARSRWRRSPRRRRGHSPRRGRSRPGSRPPRAARRTRSARGRSRRPPRPTRARRARARSSRRRRSRRTRGAYPRAAASAISSSAICSAASGRATLSIAALILASRPGSSSSERAVSGARPSSLSGITIAPPARLEVARVLRLVIGGRERVRHEHRRQPGGRELPDRRAAAHQREIRRAVGRAEPVEHRQQHVVRPRDARRAARRSRARPRCAGRPDRSRRRPRPPARSASARRPARRRRAAPAPSAGRPSCARASSRGSGRALSGIARPVTTYFGGLRPGIGYERKTRLANGAARRLARPRWASASVSAAGIRRRAAATTIGPAT